MAQNHSSATPMGLTTVAALEIAKGCVASQGIYDSDSGCFCWSSITQRQYQVSTGQKFQKGVNKADACYALTQIEANAGWNMDILTLFDAAYNCTANGKAGGPVINVNTDYTQDFLVFCHCRCIFPRVHLVLRRICQMENVLFVMILENIRYDFQYSLY